MGPDREAAWAAVLRAADDRSSGAAEIARDVAEAIARLRAADVRDALVILLRGHPPMAPLWRLATEALGAVDAGRAARGFAAALEQEPRRVAGAAARLLRGEVVTHSYSSTLVAAVAEARVPALCARSEPGGEGLDTARRLAGLGVPARMVDDEAARDAVARGRTAVVGADAVGPGGVVNKVGTGELAEAAGAGGAPCYVVTGSSKLLAADLPAPPPFERTPVDRFTAIVTERGAMDGDRCVAAARAHTLHPSVVPLLQELGGATP